MFCHASPPVGGTADTINLDGKHFHPDCRAATAAKGTVNLFVCLDVNRPWRRSKVTQRRRPDYAQCMGELVDVHYPDAACIRVVQDNLSNHSAGALSRPPRPDAFCAASSSTTPQTRQLAQHGGNRDRRRARPMPGPLYR
ncbi:hypothetical protein ACVWZ3_000179 [Bradyrhizobium sp. i1.3.6]